MRLPGCHARHLPGLYRKSVRIETEDLLLIELRSDSDEARDLFKIMNVGVGHRR